MGTSILRWGKALVIIRITTMITTSHFTTILDYHSQHHSLLITLAHRSGLAGERDNDRDRDRERDRDRQRESVCVCVCVRDLDHFAMIWPRNLGQTPDSGPDSQIPARILY